MGGGEADPAEYMSESHLKPSRPFCVFRSCWNIISSVSSSQVRLVYRFNGDAHVAGFAFKYVGGGESVKRSVNFAVNIYDQMIDFWGL